jgi:glutamate synthase (NADPH/NADH) large chain
VLKVMSKMGISTVASYTGAQVFEAIGLGRELVDEYFTGTVSRLGGIGLDVLADEIAARHASAYPANPALRAHRTLDLGGEYQWRREGEYHLFNPETCSLQHTSGARWHLPGVPKLVDDQSRFPAPAVSSRSTSRPPADRGGRPVATSSAVATARCHTARSRGGARDPAMR